MRWSLVVFTLALGCVPSDTPEQAILDPVTVEVPDIRVVGTSDSIASIVDLAPANDGSVWILNNAEPYLIQLSPDGAAILAHGANGRGPRELSWPSTLVRDTSTGAVRVFDSSLGALLSVDLEDRVVLPRGPSGAFGISTSDWLWMNNGGRFWIRSVDDQVVFARPTSPGPWIHSLWTTDIVRVKGEGDGAVVLSTNDIVGDSSRRFPGAQRFLPFPLWAACPDGTLAIYDPNRNALHRFSTAGDRLTVHSLPPEQQLGITVERLFSTVYPGVLRNRLITGSPERAEFFQVVKRDYETRADEFSEVFPEYVNLECASENTLWLQVFDTTSGQMGRGPGWLRITEAGAQGEVRFPDTFRPMRFAQGRIWGIHRAEFDVDHVAWTEVPGQ